MVAVTPAKATTPHLDQAIAKLTAAAKTPGRQAFAARVTNALALIAAETDEATLVRAAGAASEYDVLLEALATPAALATLREDDPLAPARLRGLQQQRELLQMEGGTLTAAQAADLIGVTRQAIDKRRRAGTLIGLSLGRRGYAYPAWQFVAGRGALPGLERVLRAMTVRSPWMRAAFMLNGNTRLNGASPLQTLRKGCIEPVVSAARAYGEHVGE